MSKIIVFTACAVLLVLNGFAQECGAALVMKKGRVLEYTSYTKKGKEDGKTLHETLSSENNGGKFMATIKSTIIDKKGEEAFLAEYKAMCEKGLFSVDMTRFFNTAQLSQYGDESQFSLEMDGNVLEFLGEMSPDTILNDGNFTVKVNSNDFTLVTMTFDITNRKVVGNETITTPAGTFECQKVTFDFNSKVGIIKVRGSGVEWYLKDKVIVRSESYNKKGKLLSYSELTNMR